MRLKQYNTKFWRINILLFTVFSFQQKASKLRTTLSPSVGTLQHVSSEPSHHVNQLRQEPLLEFCPQSYQNLALGLNHNQTEHIEIDNKYNVIPRRFDDDGNEQHSDHQIMSRQSENNRLHTFNRHVTASNFPNQQMYHSIIVEKDNQTNKTHSSFDYGVCNTHELAAVQPHEKVHSKFPFDTELASSSNGIRNPKFEDTCSVYDEIWDESWAEKDDIPAFFKT